MPSIHSDSICNLIHHFNPRISNPKWPNSHTIPSLYSKVTQFTHNSIPLFQSDPIHTQFHPFIPKWPNSHTIPSLYSKVTQFTHNSIPLFQSDFCLSRSHYTDTDPTSRQRAATAGIEPSTSLAGVARSTDWATRPPPPPPPYWWQWLSVFQIPHPPCRKP